MSTRVRVAPACGGGVADAAAQLLQLLPEEEAQVGGQAIVQTGWLDGPRSWLRATLLVEIRTRQRLTTRYALPSLPDLPGRRWVIRHELMRAAARTVIRRYLCRDLRPGRGPLCRCGPCALLEHGYPGTARTEFTDFATVAGGAGGDGSTPARRYRGVVRLHRPTPAAMAHVASALVVAGLDSFGAGTARWGAWEVDFSGVIVGGPGVHPSESMEAAWRRGADPVGNPTPAPSAGAGMIVHGTRAAEVIARISRLSPMNPGYSG